ncbi:MAG: pyridoxamine 5'-phosphate oxidase family protein [Chloracidobacterium sp.]|nr:pyridoxamine 5'-phosphate oxidase family protein [Chloracidobacterium sp.]
MIEIQEMSERQIDELLERVRYGHFGCSRNDQPYIVPIHYSYKKPDLYVYTTDGKKTEIIRANPTVCLQVEEVFDDGDWQSVIVTGEAERIEEIDEREAAMAIIQADNPKLAPAISVKWLDSWIRENVEIIYRIRPRMITGRIATQVETQAAVANPMRQRPQIY